MALLEMNRMNGKKRLLLGFVLTMVASLVSGSVLPTSIPTPEPTYVEPDLLSSGGETLSLIVTAGDSAAGR